MAEGNFLSRHWKKLAAGVAAVGVTAGSVELGKLKGVGNKERDAGVELEKVGRGSQENRDMAAIDSARRLRDEERSREKDAEAIKKLKQGIVLASADPEKVKKAEQEFLDKHSRATLEGKADDLRVAGLGEVNLAIKKYPELFLGAPDFDDSAGLYYEDKDSELSYRLAFVYVDPETNEIIFEAEYLSDKGKNYKTGIDGLEEIIKKVRRDFITDRLEDDQYDMGQAREDYISGVLGGSEERPKGEINIFDGEK